VRVFTKEELAEHGAGSASGQWLAVLGHVYDVTAGGKFYAEGGGYAFFSGRDASAAFVTGKFEGDGLTDDLSGLSPKEVEGVAGWKDFYENDEKYPFLGLLAGRYFDSAGQPTAETATWKAALEEAKEANAAAEADKARYHSCSSRWTQAAGTTFWCKKGLVPRRYLRADPWAKVPAEAVKERCACVVEDGPEADAKGLSTGGEGGQFLGFLPYYECGFKAAKCTKCKDDDDGCLAARDAARARYVA
jgi:predicted heme/steroid binding protein